MSVFRLKIYDAYFYLSENGQQSLQGRAIDRMFRERRVQREKVSEPGAQMTDFITIPSTNKCNKCYSYHYNYNYNYYR